MNGKKYSKLVGIGYLVMALILLVVALPAAADDNESEMLPEDAKLGQYITSQHGSEMAPVDAKLGQYIVDDFDYAAAAEIQTYRWQAMADFYTVSLSTGTEMAAVDAKLGQYIVDDFDYTAAAE